MGTPTLRGGRQHTILPNFPKNCMKLKEFGPRGGASPKFYYVDPPLINIRSIFKAAEPLLFNLQVTDLDLDSTVYMSQELRFLIFLDNYILVVKM